MDSQAEEEARKEERRREIERRAARNKRLRGTWDGEGKLETVGLCVCVCVNQTTAQMQSERSGRRRENTALPLYAGAYLMAGGCHAAVCLHMLLFHATCVGAELLCQLKHARLCCGICSQL